MSLTSAAKAEIINQYQRADKDTGSPEVQVSLITSRIKYLTEHFKTNKKDFHSDVVCKAWLISAVSY